MRRFVVTAASLFTIALVALTVAAPGAGAATRSSQAALTAAGPGPQVPTSIPVFDWHELNNGCASTAAVCSAPDPESVSTTQLRNELSYLKTQGYQTITAAQYLGWIQGSKAPLPAKPVLLVADNGIESFLAGAAPILKQFGDTLTVAIVTGFADGASGICPQPAFEPGCPADNEDGNWDATWQQLQQLPASNYNFIIESGVAGHFVQNYDPNCTAFYACMVPGETANAYESRVQSELNAGQSEIIAKVQKGRFTAGLWVVPYSDLGYTACTAPGCTAQPSDGPAGWLASWAASTFPVAFVEDAFRNGVQNERFRIDVQGWMTQTDFSGLLTSHLAAGDFTLTHTAGPPVLPPPPPPPPLSTTPVAAIPVLSLDSTTMTPTQAVAELTYLQTSGYNTISAASYVSWAGANTTELPPKPILVTVTGDNAAFLSAITPYLYSDGYSAVAFVSTQQADAGGTSATWTQLAALTSSAWQFSFSSGAAGGSLVASDPTSCNIYYACKSSGETDAAYETRVANEIGAGRLELDNTLWMQTVNDLLWSPPFGDVGQAGQPYNGPAGWLSQWASWVFPVVFVPGGASGFNQHNVLNLNGSTTEATFETTLATDVANGIFNLG